MIRCTVTRRADTHLRVCIEDFDPLGRDEQIHLSESLRFSVCTLLRDKKRKKKKEKLLQEERVSSFWIQLLLFKVNTVI